MLTALSGRIQSDAVPAATVRDVAVGADVRTTQRLVDSGGERTTPLVGGSAK
jgi:hypothetical protein